MPVLSLPLPLVCGCLLRSLSYRPPGPAILPFGLSLHHSVLASWPLHKVIPFLHVQPYVLTLWFSGSQLPQAPLLSSTVSSLLPPHCMPRAEIPVTPCSHQPGAADHCFSEGSSSGKQQHNLCMWQQPGCCCTLH